MIQDFHKSKEHLFRESIDSAHVRWCNDGADVSIFFESLLSSPSPHSNYDNHHHHHHHYHKSHHHYHKSHHHHHYYHHHHSLTHSFTLLSPRTHSLTHSVSSHSLSHSLTHSLTHWVLSRSGHTPARWMIALNFALSAMMPCLKALAETRASCAFSVGGGGVVVMVVVMVVLWWWWWWWWCYGGGGVGGGDGVYGGCWHQNHENTEHPTSHTPTPLHHQSQYNKQI